MTLRITPINSVGRKTRDYHGIDFDSDATRTKTKIYYDGNGNARVLSEKYSKEAINQIISTINADKEITVKATPAISKVSQEKVWLNTQNEAYSKIPDPDYTNTEPYALRWSLATSHATGRVWQGAEKNTFQDAGQYDFGSRVVIAQLDCVYRYANIDLSAGPVVYTFPTNESKRDEHFVTCQWFDLFGRHEGLTHFGDGEVKVVVCREDDDVSDIEADHIQRMPTDYGAAVCRIQRQCFSGYTQPTSEVISRRTPPENNFWDIEPNDYNLDLAKTSTRGEHVRYAITHMDPNDFTAYTDKLLEFVKPQLNVNEQQICNNFTANEATLQAFRAKQITSATEKVEVPNRLSSGWVSRIYEDYSDSDWDLITARHRTAIWPVPMHAANCNTEYAYMDLPKGKQFYFDMTHFNATYFWSFSLYSKLNYLNGSTYFISSQFGLTPGPNNSYRIFVTHERPASLDNDAGEYWLPLHATDSHRIVYRCYGSDGNRAQALSKITLL